MNRNNVEQLIYRVFELPEGSLVRYGVTWGAWVRSVSSAKLNIWVNRGGLLPETQVGSFLPVSGYKGCSGLDVVCVCLKGAETSELFEAMAKDMVL